MDSVAEELFYQENDSGLFIKAQGHITAAVSTDLRELISNRLARPPIPPLFAVDLAQCEYMDSTFMGLLVGFHKRYRVLSGRALTILRPSTECQKLLNGLGILKLMNLVTSEETLSPTTWESLKAMRPPTTDVVLTAHHNLSELSPENRRRFSVVEEVLKQELQKKDPS